jgi:hypothetical protein
MSVRTSQQPVRVTASNPSRLHLLLPHRKREWQQGSSSRRYSRMGMLRPMGTSRTTLMPMACTTCTAMGMPPRATQVHQNTSKPLTQSQ